MKKWMKVTGIVVAIAIVGVLVVGAIAFAQGPDTQDGSPPANGWQKHDGPFDGRGNRPGGNDRFGGRGIRPGFRPNLDVLTEALGMSAEDLRAALADGQTLPEIAEAQGVDWVDAQAALLSAAEEQLAQAVEDGKLTQEQADAMLEKLQERDWSAPPPHPCDGRPDFRPNLDVLTEALGMSAEDLRAALADGQTLPEIAEAQGVDIVDVAEAMYNSAVERVQAAVEDGKLTQEQADTILQKLTDRYERCVNDGDCAPARPHRPGFRPMDGSQNQPSFAPPAANTL